MTISARLCFVLSAALFVLACGNSEPDAPEGAGAAPAAPAPHEPALVEVVTLETADFEERITLTGETAPIRTAVIASQIPGRIVALDVTEGEAVRAGAGVLRVDTAPSVAQRAQLTTQIAALERDIARAQLLVERGIGTLTEAERLATQRDLARDQLAALDVSISQGRMSAPISGIVTQKLAEVGEYANPGAPLARIVDVSTLVVWVGLPERELASVREGMPVDVSVTATGAHVVGTLHRIGVEGDVASRTFPLEIHIDNSDGALRAGMRCSVELDKRRFPSAVIIPRDAILQGIEGPEVLVHAAGVAERRQITVGPGRGSLTVVLDGLSAGDSLIVRGHRLLVPGEAIRVAELGNCCARQLGGYLDPAAGDAAASVGEGSAAE